MAEHTQTEDEWLSVADVAKQLRMHPATVRKWANEGRLPGRRIGGRLWRFRRSAVQQLEGEDRPAAAAPAATRARGADALDPLALTSDADLVELDEL